MSSANSGPEILGRGRSAVVYRIDDAGAGSIARKVFQGDALANLVHIVVSGAPNPYAWNEDAIRAAVLRRRMLKVLLRYWFGVRLRLPALYDASWDPEARVFRIDMELVHGRGAALRKHTAGTDGAEQRTLVNDVMRPLQRHLRESGFDGLVWQAGFGNPVASSNFMLDLAAGETDEPSWVWIDLESGVPALFPLDLRTLFGYYLPRSLKHRGALFDDVDVATLRGYLDTHAPHIAERQGWETADRLVEECAELVECQRRWKTMGRLRSSLGYARQRGHISPERAEYYGTRPLRWYRRLGARALAKTPHLALRVVRRLWRTVVPVSIGHTIGAVWTFLISQRQRARLAVHLVRLRFHAWLVRGQLSQEEHDDLVAHIGSEEATIYLTDFGIHLALKVPVKFIEWAILPLLFAAGLIGEAVLVGSILFGGMAARTAYTGGRVLQAFAWRRERPWIALLVGLVPVIGNAAYPLQILRSSAGRDHEVAPFMLIDLFTSMGRKLPIWGGPDTRTEHFFNALGAGFVRLLTP